MLPSILIIKFVLLLFIISVTECFIIQTNVIKSFNPNPYRVSFNRYKPNVYHDIKLQGLVSNPIEFNDVPDFLKYENLINFIPDRVDIIHNFKRGISRFRRVTLRSLYKLRFKTLSNFRKCYYDLLDEIKFWYLKGSNFSFYDLFTLGDNPVYLLVKLNLAVFIFDIIFKNEFSKMFSIKGLNLFYKNEHYRILTSLFIHSDIRHLLSNLGSLLSIGNNVIKIFGPKNLIIIYFLSGIIGNYISYLYNYIYKNGIPANLLFILRSIGKNFTNATKPILTATNTIVDDIFNKTKRLIFPIFMFDYLFTSFTMSIDLLLSKLAELFAGVTPRSLNEVDLKVKEICMNKSYNDYKSCGASSSILGLYGALITYYIRSGYINNYSIINNLFVSFIIPYILRSFDDKPDHISHFVGLLTGSILSTTLD